MPGGFEFRFFMLVLSFPGLEIQNDSKKEKTHKRPDGGVEDDVYKAVARESR